MKEKSGIGIVTQNGIWFDGSLYSCSLAIHEKWFERAHQVGGWPVAVKSQDEEQIVIIIEDGLKINCYRIEFLPCDLKKVRAYYSEFQRLMALRKELADSTRNCLPDKHLR
ncbi:hypothetical protein [Effusibacillus consociatus]|uniref:Uncharacterized protein n=1 Tax=Effusibacillus consociatus TaxID=1117041 RepID=A0ABV9PWA4_9BACL